jgi:hypothetical protein
MLTLADSFDVVASSLPPSLVTAVEQEHLRSLASTLAPFPRCGFEIRLGDSARVDLQQWLTLADGEPRRLRSH